jgi:hypothetical protein
LHTTLHKRQSIKPTNVPIQSEIEAAVSCEIDGLADGLNTSHVHDHIRDQYRFIDTATAELADLSATLRSQTSQIRTLHLQHEEILAAVWNIKLKRRAEAQREAELAGWKRKQRIRKHFRDHVSDVEYKVAQSMMKLKRERGRRKENADVISGLENEILEACLAVGKGSPEEVFEELAPGPKPYLVHKDGIKDIGDVNNGGGGRAKSPAPVDKHGPEFKDALAKPSPLRVVKNGVDKVAPLEDRARQSNGREFEYDVNGSEFQTPKVAQQDVHYDSIGLLIDDYAVQPLTLRVSQTESQLNRLYTPSYMQAKAEELYDGLDGPGETESEVDRFYTSSYMQSKAQELFSPYVGPKTESEPDRSCLTPVV